MGPIVEPNGDLAVRILMNGGFEVDLIIVLAGLLNFDCSGLDLFFQIPWNRIISNFVENGFH